MKWKLIFIVAVVAFCVWSLYPSVSYYTLSADAKARLSTKERGDYIAKALKLGLDLQGGMHVVLEVDDSKLDDNAKRDVLDRAIRIMRNRVDQFGVAEPVIQKQGDKRMIIQLPGVEDPERVRKFIGQTALLEFRLVREADEIGRVLNDLDRVLQGVTVEGTVIDTTGVTGSADTTAAGIDVAGADTSSDPAQTPSLLDSIIPELIAPAVDVPIQEASDDRPFSSFLVNFAQGGVVVEENDRATVNALLATEQAKRVIPRNSQFLWHDEARPLQDGDDGGELYRVMYMVERSPTLTGRTLVDASTAPDQDNPTYLNVSFRLNRQGALIFSRFTGENIGRRIAIVLDNKVKSAPVVQTKIPGGEGRITGVGSDEEAADLAIVLRAGALPAPVNIIEERTVGPTLGHDSIVLGVRAAIGGFLIVMLFMLIYYRLSGILACAALIFNLVIILAVLAKLHAALSLPGIAGLILTIGMAIDANVLIFERIREELAKAKTVRSAIESGYNRAFKTILDANVTTLITAVVLWQFGTGPIKGFATTLSIGIIASMFTALLCTRVVFDLITAKRMLKKLSI